MNVDVRRRIALTVPEDLSKESSYTARVVAEARALAKFGQVDLYAYEIPRGVGELCLCHRLRRSGVVGGISRRESVGAYWALCKALLLKRYDYVFIPTVFHPFFPLLFVAACAGGSRVIYGMDDPLYETMKIMRKEVTKRSHSPVAASMLVSVSPLAEMMILKLSTYVVTVSPSLKAMVVSRHGKDRANVFVAYNYVPTVIEETQDTDGEFGRIRRAKETVVMYFGHIQPEVRGIETVLRAFTLLPNSRYHFVMMGEIQNKGYFEGLVRELNLEDRVSILDPKPKEQALGYLKKADFGILGPHPSFALPSKLFDYLYTGVPIVLSSRMEDAIGILGPTAIVYDSSQGLADVLQRASEYRDRVTPVTVLQTKRIEPLAKSLDDIFSRVFGAI